MPKKQIIFILDIDGTLTRSIFKNVKNSGLTKTFLEKLTRQKPYKYTIKFKTYDNGINKFYFITGRSNKLNKLTKKWIEKNLKIKKFVLIHLNYKNYSEYIRDKVNAVEKVANKYQGKNNIVMIYEDDENVVHDLIKHGLKNSMIYLVKDGRRKIVYKSKST